MSRRNGWTDSTLQRLPLETLSIEALREVLGMLAEYDLEFQKYEGRRAQLEEAKKSLRTAASSATQQMNDVDTEIAQVFAQLVSFEVGIIGKWLLSAPTVRAAGRYYRPEAQPLIARWSMLCDRRNELRDLHDSLTQKLHNMQYRREYEPKKEAKLRYQSQTFLFDISAIKPERVDRIVEKKKKKAALEEEWERSARTKLGQTKAKAAAYENKQRELAKAIRTALRKQLKVNPCCPYCNMELSSEDPHADHIHPVVKGGLSTIGNMVFVCQSCNVKKGTLTLRAFLKKMDYVEAEVYERLERMGKDV